MENSILSEISLTDSRSQKFTNKEEEFEFYKNNYKTLEKNLLQYETKIKALETSNKKLQELMNQNKRGGNNTSTQFFLPSEFKKNWENLTETELLAPFDNCLNNYIFISNICQDLTIITYNETKDIIEKKVDSLLLCLNIKVESNEKRLQIISKFIPFFQEHFFEIFKLNEENIENIKNQLKEISNLYQFDFNKKDLEDSIKDNQFNILLQGLFKVCLHMLLHEPLLTFNIVPYDKRKIEYFYYDKKEFQSIEGFGSEKTPCLIILPPPVLRNSFPFNGMKSAAYLIENPTKEMIDECNFKQKEKDEKNKSNHKERKSTEKKSDYKDLKKSIFVKKDINENKDLKNNDNEINTNLNINDLINNNNYEVKKINDNNNNINKINNQESINENIENNINSLKTELFKNINSENEKKENIINMNNINDNNINNNINIINDNNTNDSTNNTEEIKLKTPKPILENLKEEIKNEEKVETPTSKKVYNFYSNIESLTPNKNENNIPIDYIKTTANILNSERIQKNNNTFFHKPLFSNDEEINDKYNHKTSTPNIRKEKENIFYKYNAFQDKSYKRERKIENIPVTHLYNKYPNASIFDRDNRYRVTNFNLERDKHVKKKVNNHYSNNSSFNNPKVINNYRREESFKGNNLYDNSTVYQTIPYNSNTNIQNLNDLYNKYYDYRINYFKNDNNSNKYKENDNYLSTFRNNHNYDLNEIGLDYLRKKYNISLDKNLGSYTFNY